MHILLVQSGSSKAVPALLAWFGLVEGLLREPLTPALLGPALVCLLGISPGQCCSTPTLQGLASFRPRWGPLAI